MDVARSADDIYLLPLLFIKKGAWGVRPTPTRPPTNILCTHICILYQVCDARRAMAGVELDYFRTPPLNLLIYSTLPLSL